MSRVAAQTRMLIALLLLVAGQMGVVASAHAAACPRAALRRAALALPADTAGGRPTSGAEGATAAVLVDARRHGAHSPVDGPAAVQPHGCGAAPALAEHRAEPRFDSPRSVPALRSAALPPGSGFTASLFRPPRTS